MLSFLDTTLDAGLAAPKLLHSDIMVDIHAVQKLSSLVNRALCSMCLGLRFPGGKLWGMAPLFDHPPLPGEVEAVLRACLMVKREVFERAGGFDPYYCTYC